MADEILQVITDTDRRGAQVFAVDLHRALEKRGRQVRTVALAPGQTGGLDNPVLGSRPLSGSTLKALRREIRGAEIVVAHGSTTLPASAIASLGTRTPFVYRQISDSRFWASTMRRRLRVQAGLWRASAVVALWSGSAETLHDFLHVPRQKISVIPNGVPPDRFPPAVAERTVAARIKLGIDAQRPTVMYLGALVPEKGVDLAVDAVAELPEAQLVIAGDGPERDTLERLATRRAPGRVHFVGSVVDPASVYATADVVVLPSRGGDSMPAVLIEAGLSGLPAVATPVAGIPEVVIDNITGFLIPIGSPGSLRGAIGRLLDDRDLATQFGLAAHAHCTTRFSIDQVATQWAAVLDAVVKS